MKAPETLVLSTAAAAAAACGLCSFKGWCEMRRAKKAWHDILDSLEARVNADGTSGHVLDLSWNVLAEAGLVLGQHF